MPRFSVVITTRNRSDLVLNSLQSVLEQDFRDFEVIVSDNSDDDQAGTVSDAIKPFLSDTRFRYIRTPRPLPMTAHWEWAVSQAIGDYVGILTDRMVFRLYTLSTVDALIAERKPSVICFERVDLIEAANSFGIPPTKTSHISIRTKRTLETIEAFSRSDFRPLDNPRFLNGFASSEFLAHLRSEYGSVFTGVAPDYGFLMRVLDQLDEFPFIETPLLVKHSEARSNGKSFTHYNLTKTSHDWIEFMRAEQSEFLAFSPIPDDLVMVSNLLVREYEIGRHNQRRSRFPAFDKQSFYNKSIIHLRALKNKNKDVDGLLERMEEYRVENQLGRHRLRVRELRRLIKARIRSTLAIGAAAPRERGSNVTAFPTMIEALREEAQRFGQTRASKQP
jgi:glycosyltransferase involved in cell wall biosynthesis